MAESFITQVARELVDGRKQKMTETADSGQRLACRVIFDVELQQYQFGFGTLEPDAESTDTEELLREIIAASINGFNLKLSRPPLAVILDTTEDRLEEIMVEILGKVFPAQSELLILFMPPTVNI